MSSPIINAVAVVFVVCAATVSAQDRPQAGEPPHQEATGAPVATASTPASHPDEPPAAATPLPAVEPSAPAGSQPHRCQMAANHGQLQALVTAMNESAGLAKVDAMAAVLNLLVSAHAHCGMMAHTAQTESASPAAPAPDAGHVHGK